MSWDPNAEAIKSSNPGTKIVAICGWNEGVYQIWGKTCGCNFTAEEVKIFTKSESEMRSKGVYLGGTKYILLRHEQIESTSNWVTYLKSKPCNDEKPCNAAVYTTPKAGIVIVGEHDTQGGRVNGICIKGGEYLTASGF